jgi:hypothetical protein
MTLLIADSVKVLFPINTSEAFSLVLLHNELAYNNYTPFEIFHETLFLVY